MVYDLSLNQGETDSVEIGREVRQGYCMSPILFNLYGEFNEVLLEVGRFKIGRRIMDLWMVRLPVCLMFYY